MNAPLRQRLRTVTSREHLAAVFARLFPRRIDRVLLCVIAAVIIAGTVLRADVIGTNNRISTDEYGYAENANRILADQPLVTFKWAPGTSLMFAAAAQLRGYDSIAVVTDAHGVAQYSQLLTELLTLVLVAFMGWVLAGPWAALIAVTLMATYEPLIDITRTYLSEPLGALAFLALVATACWARRRDRHSLLLAGIVGGLAGLVREDFAIAVAVVMVGLLIDSRRSPRAAILRTLVYGAAALATVSPFVVYASVREHRFTPIVSAGPNALFLGTYLPGGGNQFIDIEVLSKQVCAYFRHTHPFYCHLSAGDARGVEALLVAQHPGDSEAVGRPGRCIPEPRQVHAWRAAEIRPHALEQGVEYVVAAMERRQRRRQRRARALHERLPAPVLLADRLDRHPLRADPAAAPVGVRRPCRGPARGRVAQHVLRDHAA